MAQVLPAPENHLARHKGIPHESQAVPVGIRDFPSSLPYRDFPRDLMQLLQRITAFMHPNMLRRSWRERYARSLTNVS